MPPQSSESRQNRLRSSNQRPLSNEKKPKKKRGGGIRKIESNPAFLEGLEDDIVNDDVYDDEEKSARDGGREAVVSDNSRKTLIDDQQLSIYNRKSMPTDKYYVESEKKFEGQSKLVYEKRIETRKQRELEMEIKQRQKEEQKYQIHTPRTALNAHKFLRTIFLFIHGINVGFQFWQAVSLNFINYKKNTFYTTSQNDTISTEFPVFYAYQNLALPIHCISYFFITICIIDCMDR